MHTLTQPARPAPGALAGAPAATPRVSSQELLQDSKVVEIEHEGKIYELRVTRLNKLILTA